MTTTTAIIIITATTLIIRTRWKKSFSVKATSRTSLRPCRAAGRFRVEVGPEVLEVPRQQCLRRAAVHPDGTWRWGVPGPVGLVP